MGRLQLRESEFGAIPSLLERSKTKAPRPKHFAQLLELKNVRSAFFFAAFLLRSLRLGAQRVCQKTLAATRCFIKKSMAQLGSAAEVTGKARSGRNGERREQDSFLQTFCLAAFVQPVR
jgi:hypothetical protein